MMANAINVSTANATMSYSKTAAPQYEDKEHQRADNSTCGQLKPLCIGIIRAGTVLVRLFGSNEQVVLPYILACTSLTGKSRIAAEEGAKAEDSRALDDLQQRLSLRTKQRLSAHSNCVDLVFSLDAQEIYERMAVRHPDAPGVIDWATRDTSLRSLLPRDREAFRERLSFEVRRHIDSETVRFVTGQVLRVNTPLPTTINNDALGYLINTFVIHAYKCAEIDHIDSVARSPEVRRMVFEALSKMPPTGDGVRDDPNHLYVSIHTALWHLETVRQNARGAIESLSAIYDRYRQGEGRKLPVNHSYNFCLSLLIYGILLFRSGLIEDAKRSFWATIECFRRAVATGTKNATWFREMGDSHAAAANAFDILDHLRRQEAFGPDFLIEMSEAALRVRAPHFKEAAARLIQSVAPQV